MLRAHRTQQAIWAIFFAGALSACGGSSDSSGSSVASDEAVRACFDEQIIDSGELDETLLVQSAIELEVNQLRSSSSRQIQTFNNDQLLIQEETRSTEFKDQLEFELDSLQADVIDRIDTIVSEALEEQNQNSGSNSNGSTSTATTFRCLSERVYPYLYTTHKDALTNVTRTEVAQIETSPSEIEATDLESIGLILAHYCAITASLESSGILIPRNLASDANGQRPRELRDCE